MLNARKSGKRISLVKLAAEEHSTNSEPINYSKHRARIIINTQTKECVHKIDGHNYQNHRINYINEMRQPIRQRDSVAFRSPSIELRLAQKNQTPQKNSATQGSMKKPKLEAVHSRTRLDSGVTSSMNLEDEALAKDPRWFLSLPTQNTSIQSFSGRNSHRASSVKLPKLDQNMKKSIKAKSSCKEF